MFNSIIHTYFRLFTLSHKNKMQLLYCSLSVCLLLLTASWYLRSPILWSFFIFWSVIFRATDTNPQPAFSRAPTFGGTQHYLQSDVKRLHFTM